MRRVDTRRRINAAPPTPKQLQAEKYQRVYDQWLTHFFGMKPTKIQQAVDNLNATLNGRRYDQMKAEAQELIALGMHNLGRDKLTECQNVGIE